MREEKIVAGRVTESLEPYMLRLYPLLERQQRGGTLTKSEIERAAGTTIAAHSGIMQRVVAWFDKHRGIRVRVLAGDVYLLTAEEQAIQFPARDFKRGRRHWARTLARVVAVPPTDLSPRDRDKQELIASAAQAQFVHASGGAREVALVLTGKQTKRLGE